MSKLAFLLSVSTDLGKTLGPEEACWLLDILSKVIGHFILTKDAATDLSDREASLFVLLRLKVTGGTIADLLFALVEILATGEVVPGDIVLHLVALALALLTNIVKI